VEIDFAANEPFFANLVHYESKSGRDMMIWSDSWKWSRLTDGMVGDLGDQKSDPQGTPNTAHSNSPIWSLI
jgi:hypothetical protein